MSLAATLAAGGMRPASFLPSVTCSHCGNEIEIAHMGEHICSFRSEPEPPGHNPYTSLAPSNQERWPAPSQEETHPEWPVPSREESPQSWPNVPPPLVPQSQSYSNNPFTMQTAHDRKPSAPSMPPTLQYGQPAVHATQEERGANLLSSSMGSPQRAISPPQRVMSPPQRVMSPPQRMMSPPQRMMSPPNTLNSPPHGPDGHRAPRSAPPRIDSTSANGPFLAPSIRTPGPDAPLSPAISSRSASSNGPARATSRAASRPRLYDPRPPSALISANMDCAFPPFPIAKPSRSGTTSGRKTPSEKPPMRSKSPQVSTPSSERERPSFSSRGAVPDIDRKMSTPPSRPFIDEPTSPVEVLSPASASTPAPYFPVTDSAYGLTRSDSLPIQPSLDEKSEVESQVSNTITLAPEQEMHQEQTPTAVHAPIPAPGSIMGFDFSETPATSPVKSNEKTKPSHGASYSNSSTSSQPFGSNSSSHTHPSPITSATSSVDAFSPVSYGVSKLGEDEATRHLPLRIGPEEPGMRAEQPARQSPPRQFALPAQPTLPEISHNPEVPDPNSRLGEPAELVESPMDPAMMSGTLAAATESPYKPEPRPPVTRTATMPAPVATGLDLPDFPAPPPEPSGIPEFAFPTRGSSLRNPQRNRSKSNAAGGADRPFLPNGFGGPRGPPPFMGRDRPSVPHPEQHPVRPQHVRRPTVGKAVCRGCGLLIEGKSVKAADGRLTGRWHKACFRCRTCEQPFITADFYVLDNQPYCEHHYHEKNGSLCSGCNRGIEGQYLETTANKRRGEVDRKYHPRCFTCVDCRQVLADDYFEIKGRVYCERHAQALMRAQSRLGSNAGGGLFPQDRRGLHAERRTTRIMMMGPGT